MDSFPLFSPRICFICLKEGQATLNSFTVGDKDNTFKTFIKVFRRFIGSTKEHSGFSCCDECINLTSKFCDTYHQYKYLEMQLDWMVVKIARLIKIANKEASRDYLSKHLKKEFVSNQVEVPELVTDFRERILQKCKLKLENSLPRISLRRRSSPLPALFQPVFITSSTESLNEILETTNEPCENTAECENGTELEDAISCHDHFDTVGSTTDEIEEADNTTNGDQIEHFLKQDLTSFSNSTTEVPTETSIVTCENMVISNLPICKKEPVNQDGIQSENISNENILFSPCTINTQTLTTKYNLRRKPSQNIIQQIKDDNADIGIIKNISLDSLSNLSNSSFSDTSTDSFSSDEDNADNNPKQIAFNAIQKLKMKYKRKYKAVRVFKCKFGKCKRYFKIKTIFENHLKLHSNGKFYCNFCPKSKHNLVLLSSHEFKIHGQVKNHMSPPKTRKWSCPRCPFETSFLSDYEAHFAFTHFGVGMEPPKRRAFEKCKICHRTVSHQLSKIHYKACHDTSKLGDKKIIRCKRDSCAAYFIKKWQLLYHHKMEHKIVQERKKKIIQCDICLIKFSHRHSLRRHKQDLHNTEISTNFNNNSTQSPKKDLAHQRTETIMEPRADKQFKCNFCPAIQDTPFSLALHESEEHSPGNFSNSIKSKKNCCCPRCPYKYSIKQAYLKHHLHVHQNVLNSESTSACKLCSGGSVYKQNSERHFKNFHKIDDGTEPFKCDQCPAYFRKSFQLQLHTIKIHQQDHKCEICGNALKTRISLINHLRLSHPGYDENPDFPLGCNFAGGCKKRFKTQVELDHHQKYGHQRPGWSGTSKKDANKFKCDKCDKGFKCHSSLQTHLGKVHGDRPFVCEECGKAFGLVTNFQQHLEFHKGPDQWKWQCAECGKKCATKQKLDVHSRTHTKEKPFICQFCGEKYAHRQNWRIHLKTKHEDEEGIEEMIGKQNKGNYLKRKGTKRGDCIIASK